MKNWQVFEELNKPNHFQIKIKIDLLNFEEL